MTVYDGVLGIDEPALNQMIQTVYQAAHQQFLVGSHLLHVPDLSVVSVDFDVAATPQAALTPSAAPRGSFSLTFPQLQLAIHYADAQAPVTHLAATAQVGLNLDVAANGTLTPSLAGLMINVPGEPDLSQILTSGLGPALIQVIEENFLKPIQIPPLVIDGVSLSMPVIETGEGRLLATVAQPPAAAGPASLAGAWPAGIAFAAVDRTLVNSILARTLTGQSFSGSSSHHWQIALIISITVDVRYTVTIGEIDVDVVPGQDGQLSGTAQLTAHATVAERNKLWSITADGTALPVARVTVSITPQNVVQVHLDQLDHISFTIDLHRVGAPIDAIVTDLGNALGNDFAGLITHAVSTRPPVPVWTVPGFQLAGGRVAVAASDLHVHTVASPDGKNLLAVTGSADVAVKPAEQHIVTTSHTTSRSAALAAI